MIWVDGIGGIMVGPLKLPDVYMTADAYKAFLRVRFEP